MVIYRDGKERGGMSGKHRDGRQLDMFRLPEPEPAKPAVDPVLVLFAEPADRLVLGNLPTSEQSPGFDAEQFLFGWIARLDASGPQRHLTGCTYECWGAVQWLLKEAWRGVEGGRPPVMTVARDKYREVRRDALAKLIGRKPDPHKFAEAWRRARPVEALA
jgi:hypothetical protein